MNKQIDFWKATKLWIKTTQAKYDGQENLTQVFAKGPFAGWSEREVIGLANKLAENWSKFPFHNKQWEEEDVETQSDDKWMRDWWKQKEKEREEFKKTL